MNKTQKTRWLKKIVTYCIAFTSVMIVATYVAAWFDVYPDDVLMYTCTVFGGELLLSAIIKVLGKDSKTPSEDKKEEKLNG